VTRTPGHPEEFPYIDIWQTLAAYPPPWLKKCFEDNCKIMMARATNIKKKKRERERTGLLSQCSKCSSVWRNGDKSSREPYTGLRLTLPMGQMMYKPMPKTAFPEAEPSWDVNEAEG
jgi:hypothetical protein